MTIRLFDDEPPPNADGIYCHHCGAPLTSAYSWRGLCVVCAEPFLNPHVPLLDQAEGNEIRSHYVEALKRLERYRIREGLSIRGAARLLSVSDRAVRRWLSGEHWPRSDFIELIQERCVLASRSG